MAEAVIAIKKLKLETIAALKEAAKSNDVKALGDHLQNYAVMTGGSAKPLSLGDVLSIAVEHRAHDVAEAITAYDKDAVSYGNNLALRLAARHGDEKMASVLILNGANAKDAPREVNEFGREVAGRNAIQEAHHHKHHGLEAKMMMAENARETYARARATRASINAAKGATYERVLN